MAAGKKAASDETKAGNTRTIRDGAEKKLRGTPGNIPDLEGQTPEELIHELRVHQVELETQAKELRRAQFELEESRDKYLDLYDFAPVGYLTLNDTALITDANLTGAKLLGVERKKLHMARFRKFVAPEDCEQWLRYFIKVQQRVKKQSCTLTLRRGEGSVFPARLDGVRITDSDGAVSVHITISDITDIRLTEAALRESEDRFRNVIDAADAYVFEIDALGVITFLSDRVKDILGYKPQELIGKTPFDTMTSPEEVARVSLIFGEYLKSKLPIRRMEHNCRSKDGRELMLTVTALPMFDTAGEITGYQGTVEDITGRKLAEDLMKESQERYLSLFDRSMDCLYLHDFEGNFIDANPAALDLLGYSKEDIPTLNFTSLISDEYLGRALDTIRTILETGTQSKLVQYRLRCKSGEYVDVETKGSLVLQKGKPDAVLGIARDITDRKRTDEALLRVNQKLNVLSQLTRKDLTSQVFVLDSYLELAKHQLAGQDHIIGTLEKGVQAARLIHETIEYSTDYQDMGARPAKWQNVKMALLLGLSHISIGNIQHSLETADFEIFADPLLEKVFQRFFENSVKHGDHVTLIRVWHTVTPEGAIIFFEDDGAGIPEEKKEQIFSRIEGTSASRGSLIFVREILDITGITIIENGEPGKGARFEIAVPNGAYRMNAETNDIQGGGT